MGGLLHLFNFNQGSMARKIYMRKQQDDGLEAPRNSLELPAEASQGYYDGDCIPYSYQMKMEWPERNPYSTKTSVKRLIKEEISKPQSTKHSKPSVVARLMGIDTIPLDTKSVVQKHENRKKDRTEPCSVGHAPNSNIYKQLDAHQCKKVRDHDHRCSTLKSLKTRAREHPQEEELQKFKKEFEAWQAARLRECSRMLEVESIPRHLVAQEKIIKEKLPLANSRKTASQNVVKSEGHLVKSCSCARGGSQHHACKKDLLEVDQNRGSYSTKSRTASMDLEQFSMLNSSRKPDRASAPTRIVILKPGPDGIGNYEEPCASSSGVSEERGSIEDFLQEVKERLKFEMQGKAFRRGIAVRGGGIETPFSEKPSDPKQIARDIAKQVRESVSRDFGMNLLRSESTRSYRSEIHYDEPGSPEFINRDTRRFLSERLKNVLKKEKNLDIHTADERSSELSKHEDGKGMLQQTSGQVLKTRPEIQTGSFRHGADDDGIFPWEFSPRNLVRSLSAPVSGTSFGKLLLEDRHIVTGAHIRRKQEASENVAMDVKKRKKEKFNFREKVLNLRYNFILKGRFFGRKIQSVVETHSNEHEFLKDLMSGPTVVLNSCDRHENSTEVPPSPASVCSSSREEIWGSSDHVSTISTPDLSAVENHCLPQIFKEISSNLNELRRQLNELESDRLEETTSREELMESEMIELGDEAKAYVRDLLVASGLYDKSSDRTLSRYDPLAKPISNQVFEEVEESHRKFSTDIRRFANTHAEKQVDHKLLLDLLNESLSAVLGPPLSSSGSTSKVIDHTMLLPPCGRNLLERVWEIMSNYLYPSVERSNYLLDNLLVRDIGLTPWFGLTNDEISALGREMECSIIGDLIEGIVKELEE